jgi:hypothetical protein
MLLTIFYCDGIFGCYTWPEKSAIGPGLGRQSGTTPDTARHEESIGPHSAGPFRARAGLGSGGLFGILYVNALDGALRVHRLLNPECMCINRQICRRNVIKLEYGDNKAGEFEATKH